MCDGTRLIITELKDNLTVAIIITGPADLPIQFKFSLTIDKVQGQPFELVGTTYENNVLLMANCMCAYSWSELLKINLFNILLPQNKTTSNIVYMEVLSQ
ncbi:unnamed protein product [Macrosiphum euphorbiae]|uniref:Uncharacterized protein n=1 Tax=Macrosiphum euphorbiae TaxID=13131 RepID=A0AAV0WLS6_9HEMI|nr:unnamed protein product [Macrosiphum euphorbiae]